MSETNIYRPAGQPPNYGQPYGQPYVPQQQGGPGFPPPPGAGGFGGLPVPPPAPKKKTGLIIGIVVTSLVVVAGLVVGALFLFGAKSIDVAKVESAIGQNFQSTAGFAATGVKCPADVEAQAGNTFTCTVDVAGTQLKYTVKQNDDEGNLTYESDTFTPISKVEDFVKDEISKRTDLPFTATCGTNDQKIVVGGAGTTIPCELTNTRDRTDMANLNVKVANDGSLELDLPRSN